MGTIVFFFFKNAVVFVANIVVFRANTVVIGSKNSDILGTLVILENSLVFGGKYSRIW